jgi:peroxiredoxin
MSAPDRPLEPGQPAPDFTLPAINRDGTVSLRDFRGRRSVLLGFFRGLHCPFCRRQLVQLAVAQPELAAAGVETLAVVNTPLERGRLYFRHRPTPVTLLSDPDCRTHAAFGVPRIEIVTPDGGAPPRWPATTWEAFEAARINPTGELPDPMAPLASNAALNRLQGFELTPADEAVFAAHGTQLAGPFLVDRDGIVRWTQLEARQGPEEVGLFPGPAALVAAARALEAGRL